MCLKHRGVLQHEYSCFGSSLKKGRHKLSLGILIKMYGRDKKWYELQKEMEQKILDARDKRGAGDKPVLQKYDPNYIV